jgi:cytochrome bd ubiquinol oxidase subunit II
MILDYAVLKLIWWFFISALFLLFFLLGGRDFGVCILLPFLSKKDDERRLVLNSISATWEGNQVWFVTAGGATFAAWPIVYASAFSGLYLALFVVLLTLILRPPGFDFRSKIADKRWRSLWDWSLFASGFVPVLVFGVALGNLLRGMPFRLDELFLSHYEGYFYQLLNPMSVCIGLAAVSLISLHGGAFLLHKVDLEVKERAKRLCYLAGMTFILLFLMMGYWISTIPGFQIAQIADLNTALNPTLKEVQLISGVGLRIIKIIHCYGLCLLRPSSSHLGRCSQS